MLKTFELCPRKFSFKYVKNINMPINDDVFDTGKNLHALASYYLKKENIDEMEKALTQKESDMWDYLKSSKYFGYEVVGTEYNLSFRFKRHFLGGRLDALVKDGDEYYILDYKTGSAPKNPKYDFQTMIYILAVKEFFKTENVNFIYIDLKNKIEVPVKYTADLESEYTKKLSYIVSQIESLGKTAKKQDCSCEYKQICY